MMPSLGLHDTSQYTHTCTQRGLILTMMPSLGFCISRRWWRYSKSSYWRVTITSVSSESFTVFTEYSTMSPFLTGSVTVTAYRRWNGTYVPSRIGVDDDDDDDDDDDASYLSTSSDVVELSWKHNTTLIYMSLHIPNTNHLSLCAYFTVAVCWLESAQAFAT